MKRIKEPPSIFSFGDTVFEPVENSDNRLCSKCRQPMVYDSYVGWICMNQNCENSIK